MPGSHDGATAFTFRIDFSDDVVITAENMRDHAIEATGATVSGAAKVNGRDDLWEITITPTGTDAITITMEGERACTETGAICSAEGGMLGATILQLVPYAAPVPTLTAAFENVPASHDGSSEFTFELRFSEAPTIGFRALRDEALSASGGTVTRAYRVVQGQSDRWTIHVEPSGNGDVTVTLPATTGGCTATDAVCTADGTPLSAERHGDDRGARGGDAGTAGAVGRGRGGRRGPGREARVPHHALGAEHRHRDVRHRHVGRQHSRQQRDRGRGLPREAHGRADLRAGADAPAVDREGARRRHRRGRRDPDGHRLERHRRDASRTAPPPAPSRTPTRCRGHGRCASRARPVATSSRASASTWTAPGATR